MREWVICFSLVLGLWGDALAAEDAYRGEEDAEVVPGVIVVKLDAASASKVASPLITKMVVRHQGGSLAPVLPAIALQAGKRASALAHTFYFHYGADTAPRTVAAEWQRHKGVIYAEPLYVHRTVAQAVDPDDPIFPDMTHLHRIEAPAAWDVIKGEEGDVLLAIVDGGTDWRHVDLIDNVWTNPNEIADNGIDDDANGFVDDLHGWNFLIQTGDPAPGNFTNVHGTTVAGVAVATTNNGSGIAGMSWNARFMAIHAGCADTGNTICSGYPGILYAVANGADIINASFSRDGEASRFEQDIIDFAYEQGALVVAAADNSNVNSDAAPRFPANYNRVLSVGATQKDNDQKASFSNYGRTVDVFAPGVGLNSTQPGNIYTNFANGTSFASPLVAGLAALVKTLHPNWSVDQIREQVRTTADPIDASNPGFEGMMGRGRVNALRAVTESGSPAIRLVDVITTDADGNGELNSGERITLRVALTNYLADADRVEVTLETEDPFAQLVQPTASIGALASGDTAAVVFALDLGTDTPEQHTLLFALSIDANSASGSEAYTDVALFRLIANPPRLADHDTGVVQTTITSTGNIGWTAFAGSSFGTGFVYEGTNLLFEGGLLVGNGPASVSDNVRNEAQNERDHAFDLAPGSRVELVEPGGLAFQQGDVSWVDTPAEQPLGIRVRQETFADTSEARDDFVIFKYTIASEHDTTLSDVFAGLFFDWDLNGNAQDFARYDSTRRLGIVQNAADAPNVLAASQLLTTHTGTSYRAIHNNNDLFENGFLEAEKWAFMRDGLQTVALDDTDVSTLLSAGPYTVTPSCPAEVAFAVLGGADEAGLREAADAAQVFWDTALARVRVNQPPVFTEALPDTAIGHVETLTFRFEATDPDPCSEVSYTLVEAPQHATLNPETGAFQFDPTVEQIGTHAFMLVATDGILADTTAFTVSVFSPVATEEGKTFVFALEASYPNPGAFPIVIPYQLAEWSRVRLEVFDLLGRQVHVLVDAAQRAGRYSVRWEGGEKKPLLASGTYIYRLSAQTPTGTYRTARRLVLVR